MVRSCRLSFTVRKKLPVMANDAQILSEQPNLENPCPSSAMACYCLITTFSGAYSAGHGIPLLLKTTKTREPLHIVRKKTSPSIQGPDWYPARATVDGSRNQSGCPQGPFSPSAEEVRSWRQTVENGAYRRCHPNRGSRADKFPLRPQQSTLVVVLGVGSRNIAVAWSALRFPLLSFTFRCP